MTQMLLFDAPANITVPAPAPQPTETPNEQLAGAASRSIPLFDSASDDIKHMGDLAKLVLLRYELLHRRRAARQSRQAR